MKNAIISGLLIWLICIYGEYSCKLEAWLCSIFFFGLIWIVLTYLDYVGQDLLDDLKGGEMNEHF